MEKDSYPLIFSGRVMHPRLPLIIRECFLPVFRNREIQMMIRILARLLRVKIQHLEKYSTTISKKEACLLKMDH